MILLETKKDKLEERLKYIELKTKKLEEEQKDLTDNQTNEIDGVFKANKTIRKKKSSIE